MVSVPALAPAQAVAELVLVRPQNGSFKSIRLFTLFRDSICVSCRALCRGPCVSNPARQIAHRGSGRAARASAAYLRTDSRRGVLPPARILTFFAICLLAGNAFEDLGVATENATRGARGVVGSRRIRYLFAHAS